MAETAIEQLAGPRRPRKRATLACQNCHGRKVRCNVTQSGPPCVNCLSDGIECEIVARGRGRDRGRSVGQPFILVFPMLRLSLRLAKTLNHLRTVENQHLDSAARSHSTGSLTPLRLANSETVPDSAMEASMPLLTPESVPCMRPSPNDGFSAIEPPGEGSSRSPFRGQVNPWQEDDSSGFCAILDDRQHGEGATLLYTGWHLLLLPLMRNCYFLFMTAECSNRSLTFLSRT